MLRFAEKHVYDTFKSRVGKDLKTIGEMIGKHIYMYMARYSWATIADICGVPHDVISKALGHTDSSTAERYYISFDWSKVDRAIEQVIEKVQSATYLQITSSTRSPHARNHSRVFARQKAKSKSSLPCGSNLFITFL